MVELLLKHRTPKAKGITISITLSLQPLLKQILTSQSSPPRYNQDSPPKSEFLSEPGVKPRTAHCNIPTAARVWFWSDCHSKHA